MKRRRTSEWIHARFGDSAAEAGDDARPCVLILEDDEAMRSVLAEALRQEGYRVIEMAHAIDLLILLPRALGDLGGRLPADAIVTDQRMPGATGLAVVECIRAYDWSIPILMISAFPDQELHSEARRLGAYAVLEKPFAIESFVCAVRSVAPLGAPSPG